MKYLIIVCSIVLVLNNSIKAQPTPVRTVVHIIRYSDGTGMSEETAREAIDILNNYFTDNNANIKFFISKISTKNSGGTTFGFDYIDCSTIDPYDLKDPIVQDALNIYFFPNIAGGGKGVTVSIPGNVCIVSYNSALLSTLAHEVGHCFGLYHTDETCGENHSETVYENIIRIPNQTCSPNCDVAGDRICDTPAQRNPNGSSTDECGNEYPTTNPNEGNMMDVQSGDGVRNYFTYGQKQRMQYYLQTYLYNLIFKVNLKVSNKIGQTNQLGTTLHIDGVLVNSGSQKELLYGITHTSKTDYEVINNNYKHHDWDNHFSNLN